MNKVVLFFSSIIVVCCGNELGKWCADIMFKHPLLWILVFLLTYSLRDIFMNEKGN